MENDNLKVTVHGVTVEGLSLDQVKDIIRSNYIRRCRNAELGDYGDLTDELISEALFFVLKKAEGKKNRSLRRRSIPSILKTTKSKLQRQDLADAVIETLIFEHYAYDAPSDMLKLYPERPPECKRNRVDSHTFYTMACTIARGCAEDVYDYAEMMLILESEAREHISCKSWFRTNGRDRPIAYYYLNYEAALLLSERLGKRAAVKMMKFCSNRYLKL